jgi:general secretion pathway protein D
MAENDLNAAESLVAQAEALGVQYSAFHLGDTPAKVRRDLERTRKAASTSPTRPSRLFSPLSLGSNGAPAADPFAARGHDSASLLPDAKSRAKSYLLNGRKELAQGNLSAAAHWYRKAAKQRATFGDDEDSPGKLAAEILRRGGRLDAPSQGAGSPTTRNVRPLPPLGEATPLASASQSSGPLLLGARRALAEGDVRRASDLVQQAKALGAQYGPRDDSPAKVEAVIRGYSDLMAQKAERGDTQGYRTQYARALMEQAEGLLRYGDYDRAEHLARLASQQEVRFGPYQTNPKELLDRIAAARREHRLPGSATGEFGGQDVVPATGNPQMDRTASHAVYDQSRDRTWNMLAGAQGPTPAPSWGNPGSSSGTPMPPAPSAFGSDVALAGQSTGESLFQQGEAALMAHDKAKAIEYFRQAAKYRDQLDPITAQRLQERLQMLSGGAAAPPNPTMIDQAAAAQRSLYQQMAVEVAHQESEAKALCQTDPRGALSLLEETRKKVETAGLEPNARDSLLARIDRSLADTQQYIEQNRARIDLEERSQRMREDIQREQQMAIDVQEKLALLVEEYNQLMEEQRFAEAEVVARRAGELDPENPLTRQLLTTSRLIRHYRSNQDLLAKKEEGFWEQMHGVELASIPFDDMEPYVFGDAREWEALTERRRAWAAEHGRRRTEAELEIEQKLKTPVLLQFDNAPLSQVMDYLAQMAGVNLHLDPQGLADEGVTTNDPVTINLSQEISLKSALNLVLEPLHLSYMIKDEVLKITSEQYRDGDLYQQVYNVADLVVPIPNFVPSTNMGLSGAYHDALGSVGFGGTGPFGGVGSPLAVVASRSGARNSAMVSPSVLAQMPTTPMGSGQPNSMPVGFGPGGLGGAAMADFDSLIELITTTVAPESWDDVGGPGSIAPFETNLSLVVSQTQEVHDQLVDLLGQLRRMQDLQVTIEVRFITLNDNFFERIGIDFDFDIDDDIDRPYQVFGRVIEDEDGQQQQQQQGLAEPLRDTRDVDHDRSVTVGLQTPGVFSADLDIPFTQNSFGLSVPQFGGFDATAGAQMGFAILSDIEAFFFIAAAQGDRRSNVLQAPKVTLFNGQQAFVSDTSQSPFVISVIPVVGDFAAAQQPVIVILNEGTFLTVQAVVSDDRRFVRLTVVPFFSRIGDVRTFQFEGSETTSESSSAAGDQEDPDENTSSSQAATTTRSGTTVQLPTFSYVTVTTTVSVPDGGTVLLGGIKRLSEGRNEFGVPILNKLPYISRLFKNVGIGRETQSLMMMVTPRIIIQEEEEEQLGILAP